MKNKIKKWFKEYHLLITFISIGILLWIDLLNIPKTISPIEIKFSSIIKQQESVKKEQAYQRGEMDFLRETIIKMLKHESVKLHNQIIRDAPPSYDFEGICGGCHKGKTDNCYRCHYRGIQ